MNTKKKKILLMIKLLISIVLLFFLFRRIDLSEVFTQMRAIPLSLIGLILFTAMIKQGIEITNWYLLLKINPNFKPQFNMIIRSHFIGQSLRFLIPGGHAVVGKMFFINNSKKASFLSIGVEKFFQIWIIALFAAHSSLFFFDKIASGIRFAGFIIILFLPILLYALKFLLPANKHIYFKQYLSILPKVAISKILYMFITIIQYYVILHSGSDFPFFSAFVSVPLILFANIIPITYAGLGLRETFAIGVLARYAIAPVQAVSVSLVVFAFNTFLPAIIGILFWIVKKENSRQKKN